MSKQPSNSGSTQEKSSYNDSNSAIRWVFFIIAGIFTLTMAFLVIWPIVHKSKSVEKVVTIKLAIPKDSLAVEQVLSENDSQINVLIEDLNKQNKGISDKYDLLIKSQEAESDFFRLVSCVAAFVIALLGFLGYKTIKDIESMARTVAEDEAKKASKEYTKTNLESEVESQLKDLIGDSTAAKLINEQMTKEFKRKFIQPIENRLSNLEMKSSSSDSGEEHFEESDEGAFSGEMDPKISLMNTEEGGTDHE